MRPERSVAVDARYLKRRHVGISVYLIELLEQLLGARERVTLLTDDPAHEGELASEFPSASVVVLPGASGFVWEQWRLPRYLRSAGHDVYIAGANYGLPLLRSRRTRTALVVHDLIPLRMPRTYIFPRPAWAAKYLLSTAISFARADAFVANSASTARDLRRAGARAPVWVRYPLPPAVDGAPPSPLPASWPRRYVLYNGGDDARKNVPALLEAFARFHRDAADVSLVLMGRGYERFGGRLRALGIEDCVALPGYVDDELKMAAVRGAAAVVYPSRWEGFGLPVAEALAARVPVVTGTGGSLAEVGGDAAIYVDVDDVDAIAAGLRRALEPRERERVRAQGPRQLERLRAAREPDPIFELLGA